MSRHHCEEGVCLCRRQWAAWFGHMEDRREVVDLHRQQIRDAREQIAALGDDIDPYDVDVYADLLRTGAHGLCWARAALREAEREQARDLAPVTELYPNGVQVDAVEESTPHAAANDPPEPPRLVHLASRCSGAPVPSP
jgi:hypothetical protein